MSLIISSSREKNGKNQQRMCRMFNKFKKYASSATVPLKDKKIKLYLSHCLSVQLAMIQRVTMKTSRTVPGQIVIRVFSTNRVLKLIL